MGYVAYHPGQLSAFFSPCMLVLPTAYRQPLTAFT
jgi:hypothetical protein